MYGTECGMLALREKSHYYVTLNLYMLPKNIQLYFGANVKILLGIVTYILKRVCAFIYCRVAYKSVLIKQKCVTYITSCYIRYIYELHYISS